MHVPRVWDGSFISPGHDLLKAARDCARYGSASFSHSNADAQLVKRTARSPGW